MIYQVFCLSVPLLAIISFSACLSAHKLTIYNLNNETHDVFSPIKPKNSDTPKYFSIKA